MEVRFTGRWDDLGNGRYGNAAMLYGDGWDGIPLSIFVDAEGLYRIMEAGYRHAEAFFNAPGVMYAIIENGEQSPAPEGVEVGPGYISLLGNGVAYICKVLGSKSNCMPPASDTRQLTIK